MGIKNKDKAKDTVSRAVGISYRQAEDDAPRLVAKGQRKTAEQIIKTAREHGVPVYEDPAVVELLYTMDVGREIPEELYHAIAEILAFVYRLDAGERKVKRTGASGQ